MKVKVEAEDDAAEEGEVVEKDDPKIITTKETITVLEEKKEIKLLSLQRTIANLPITGFCLSSLLSLIWKIYNPGTAS